MVELVAEPADLELERDPMKWKQFFGKIELKTK
jgi:hypothetical protein